MIYINGRFLTQKITGVQRYAIEITKAMDKIADKNKITILCPNEDLVTNIEFKNIKVLKIGRFHGHLWEQLTLPFYILRNKGKLLSLGNLAPIINPGYITIHDISFKTHPEHLNSKFAKWYKFVTKMNIKRYKHIFTVSNFSKNEIIANYKVNPNKISITYNSANHLSSNKNNEEILNKFDLVNKEYYFSLGSNSKHKNFIYIKKLAIKYPKKLFVVTGNNNSKIFNESVSENLENLIYTGYLNDNELATLYANCKAFIFPSLYEGFGIPPLEAVKMGCKHLILSDIDVLREIYGDNAVYINALDEAKLPTKLINADSKELLDKYSWDKSAKIILDCLDNKR